MFTMGGPSGFAPRFRHCTRTHTILNFVLYFVWGRRQHLVAPLYDRMRPFPPHVSSHCSFFLNLHPGYARPARKPSIPTGYSYFSPPHYLKTIILNTQYSPAQFRHRHRHQSVKLWCACYVNFERRQSASVYSISQHKTFVVTRGPASIRPLRWNASPRCNMIHVGP